MRVSVGSLLFLSLLHLAATASATPPPPTRILILGDSISVGIDPASCSWRHGLWTRLLDAGVDFDFVGTWQSPALPSCLDHLGQSFDVDHQSRSGASVDEVLAGWPGLGNLYTWLALSYTPDVALVHLGTNDVLAGESIESTIDELEALVDALRADNPTVAVLLAKITPADSPANDGIVALNAAIGVLVAAKSTPSSPVVAVDQYTGFDPVLDTLDGLHPNAAGEEKIAQTFFDALMASGLQCGDGIDNDGDGLTDHPHDPDCWDASDFAEHAIVHACDDGTDNDGDGATDHPADSGCADVYDPWEGPDCGDGLDNDQDGWIDLGDPGCDDADDESERSPALVCDDGLDNDGDSVADFPADVGCTSLLDPNELIECADGVDNDGDGSTDFPADPGCRNPGFRSREAPACDDGLDNDGDLLVDAQDPQCAYSPPWWNDESKKKGACGLGWELAGLAVLLGRLRRLSPSRGCARRGGRGAVPCAGPRSRRAPGAPRPGADPWRRPRA